MLSDKNKIINVFKWLNDFSKVYEKKLLLKHSDINRLRSDENYAKANIVRWYAYERVNAPISYKVNALKTLNLLRENPKFDWRDFYNKRVEKQNINANPFLDERFHNASFCQIIKNIEEGKLSDVYDQLSFNGFGAKIRTLYIRDITSITGSEKNIKNREDLIFTQPIDIWIMIFTDQIKWEIETIDRKNPKYKKIANRAVNYWKDVVLAQKIIEISEVADVSPVKVNQAIWLFCSRIVSDTKHLKELINKGDIAKFDQEVSYVNDFVI